VIRDPRIDFVAFTGSVAGGHAVQRVAAERFIGVGLELGGCGSGLRAPRRGPAARHREHRRRRFFNSGQSCCGLQRIYVHEKRL